MKKELHKPRIEEAISRMQAVIELGRNVRDTRKIPLKQPLMSVSSAPPPAPHTIYYHAVAVAFTGSDIFAGRRS